MAPGGRLPDPTLAWTKAPFLFLDELLAADGVDPPRSARPHEVRRLGDHPLVLRVSTGGATADVATRGKDGDLLLGPYRTPTDDPPAAEPPATAVADRGGRV